MDVVRYANIYFTLTATPVRKKTSRVHKVKVKTHLSPLGDINQTKQNGIREISCFYQDQIKERHIKPTRKTAYDYVFTAMMQCFLVRKSDIHTLFY